jgi:hypothetical protein
VWYGPPSVVDPSARIGGMITDTAAGEVLQLYAQQFPYRSAPTPVQSVNLHPVGGTATYSFTVSPTLATRYQVRLLRSGTATTPLAISAVRTIYVDDFNQYYTSMTKPISDYGNYCINMVPCTVTFPIVVHVPPAALQTEMAQQKYVYLNHDGEKAAISATNPLPVQLDADAIISKPQRVADNAYQVTVSYIDNPAVDGQFMAFCTKQIEEQDGIGIPGSSACGSGSISGLAWDVWGGGYP